MSKHRLDCMCPDCERIRIWGDPPSDLLSPCGRMIRNWEGIMMPCKRKQGHVLRCNPFSDTCPPESK